MLIASALVLFASGAAPAGPAFDWSLSPEKIDSSCKAELARAREKVKAALVKASLPEVGSPVERLVAVETAVAEAEEALTVHGMLGSAESAKVRAAADGCWNLRTAFQVELHADPALFQTATAALAAARSPVDRALALRYVEAGRHGGAALDPKARAELTALLDQIHGLESEFVRALNDDKPAVEVSPEEAASLPASFARTLKKSRRGFLVPVGLDTWELVMKNLRPTGARERFARAFFLIGGPANVERMTRVLALRRKAAQRMGFQSWAEYRLELTSAKTPERALTPARELAAVLLPRAREEIASLAAMKAAAGEPGPFAIWDYSFYQAQKEQTAFAVDPEQVRQYFPVDVVVPAALELFEQLLGLRFEPVKPASAWAPTVTQYALKDAATGALLGYCYLDLQPHEGKMTRPSSATFRVGRALPGGGRVLPLSAVVGNGPSAAKGERPLFTHQGVYELLHELGHLVDAMLSAAPYSSLSGVFTRPDFVEAPSQLMEEWAWDPATLRRLSRHVRTGEPLPAELAARLAGLRRANVGAFWTRQAFLTTYDLELNGPAEVTDPTALYFELWAKMTALPPMAGTIPEASLLPEMGGYDATYYGYLWSRIRAADMLSEFKRAGLTSPQVGLRYRRAVLEPGSTAEPEELIQSFLGRPTRPDAFYESLGLRAAGR